MGRLQAPASGTAIHAARATFLATSEHATSTAGAACTATGASLAASTARTAAGKALAASRIAAALARFPRLETS